MSLAVMNCFIGTSNSSPLIHKSRVNPNGTFSVGKTWKLADLRGIQVPNVCLRPISLTYFVLALK